MASSCRSDCNAAGSLEEFEALNRVVAAAEAAASAAGARAKQLMQLQNAVTRCSSRAPKEAPSALWQQQQELAASAAAVWDSSAGAKEPEEGPAPPTKGEDQGLKPAPLSEADDILVFKVEPLLWELQQQQLLLQQQAVAAAAATEKLQRLCRCNSREDGGAAACAAVLCGIVVSLLHRDAAFKLQMLQEVAAAAAASAAAEGAAPGGVSKAKAARLAWLAHPFVFSIQQQLPMLRRKLYEQQQRHKYQQTVGS